MVCLVRIVVSCIRCTPETIAIKPVDYVTSKEDWGNPIVSDTEYYKQNK